MANFLAVPVPTMGRRRHRAVSENVLGTELYKEREEENVLRSSWEVAKTHFGHVKVTPAPSRVKIDDDRPRERVFYVLARPSKSLLTRRPMLELHDNSPLRECDEEESEERAPKKKRKKRNRKKRKHPPETTHPTLSMMSNIKSAAKNPTKKVDEAPKKMQEDSRERQQPTVRSDLSLETLSGSQNASTSMSGDGQPEKDRYSVRKGTIEHDLVAWVTVDQIGLVRQLKGVAPPVAEMTGPTTSKMQTFRISKTENSQLDQQSQTYATIEDYIRDTVLDLEKARPIKKILVATNGIAAVKCLVSIRKRMMNLFKNDRIIKMVCMTTDQEIDSQAEYLKYADHIAIAPAGANTNNYANVDEIISQAVLNNVDAVWAGWGHASENPRLPEELAKHNIVFIGPPADAMFALGDKIASTIIAQTVQIPTIEWSGSGLVVNDPEDAPQGATVNIPSELYKQACVYNVEEGLKCLREKNITYPIMIKASEGGGGKGIRKCNNDEEFRINFRRVQTEVPGSPIFLMKCLMNARHIEVQLIADQYGQVVPFFTRDCSIQRRCQKIIEEAPAGIAPKEVLRQMQQDAVNLAKKVGYVSAGTVEYMYLPETKKYYFLELNPRLQVEHPCTEMISNINIPAIQLQVAMGLPLHRIDEIRLFFGMDRYGKSALPDDQIRTDVNICVIAARITSEDPSDQFKPASGTVMNLQFQSNQNVWGYFSVSATGKVHEYADSQFGHLFAKGSTRHEAIAAMTCALKELRVRSTFPSQINYLVDLLNDEEFQRNDFHTGWLDTRIQNNIQSVPELPVNVTLAVGATVIGHAKIAEVFSKFQSAIERGQILPTSELTETFELELVHNNVKYSVLVNRYGPINFLVKLNNSEICTEVRELGHESLLVTYSDQSYTCHLEEEIERYKVNIGRSLTIFEKENDPSVLRSRNAGRLLQYLVKDGEMVEKGETYAEMESMKMVINLEVKKAGGRLVHVARPGQALFPGTLIARLDDQGDMTSARPEEFEDDFDEWNQAEERKQLGKVRLNVKFEQLMQACKDVLDGYAVPESLFEQRKKALVDELFAILEDQSLPYTLFKVMLNVVETRINKIGTYNKIKELIAKENIEFPAQELAEEMESYMATLEPSAAAVDQQYFDPLLNICDKFRSGLKGHKRLVVEELLNAYHQTETHFQEVSYDKGVNNIKSIESNPQAVVRKVYSHTRIRAKNELLKEIIRRLDNAMIMDLQKPLKKAANLFNKENEPLALFIRETLNKIHQNRDYGQIYAAVSRRSSEKSLQDLINKPNKDSVKILDEFMTKASENQLVLHEFFFTSNKQTNSYAIRMFIRNTFYINDKDIKEIPIDIKQNTAVFKFELSEDTPLFEHHHATNKRAVYFLSVLPELDLLKSEQLLNILKKNVEPQAQNTFLFVALPTGQNGYAQFAKYAEKELRRRAKELRNEVAERLRSHGSVDLMISRAGSPPLYTHYDFSSNEKLEIFRLPEEIVDISVENSPYLLFKHNVGRISRIFVRYLLRDVKAVVKPEKYSNQRRLDLLQEKLVDVIDGACGELRVQVAANTTNKRDKNRVYFDCHHLMITLEYDSRLDTTEGFWRAAEGALHQCEQYLIRNRITEVEIVYQDTSGLASTKRSPGSVRVIYSNETGTISDVGVYRVVGNELVSIREGFARFSGQDAYAKHREIERVKVQEKRYQAREQNTTYVYDFPVVIARAVLDLWKRYEVTDPVSYQKVFNKLRGDLQMAIKNGDSRPVAIAHELVLDEEEGEIVVLDDKRMLERSTNGTNERGMIAWVFELHTPDSPEGKKIVVISNDITHQHGSFSMAEHRLYQKAGEFSRAQKLPRLYIASNSGARIGYAEGVRAKINVGFVDETKPEEGCSYLYIKQEDVTPEILSQFEYTRLGNGDYRINHVIGKERDIGVENLVGSGLIAGESSRAYEEIPTYCLVTGRAVGIGAYVARLLHRVVQVDNSHLILTGNNALNSLLGRHIYTSNGQLGGPQIMYKNGVSNVVVQSDLEGVREVLRQMSYLTSQIEQDDGERDVESSPRKGPYDVRQVLDCPEGGLFDHGSFEETVGGWARTIVCGRARLRGLAVGVVCTETNTVELEIPADPAAADSQSRVVHQAGQVWYPDSAHKTSDLINDFNREHLPLIILANIRGFSGGQKDMYEMVLKFGAQIVDALQQYTQPVIVYIPPYGELRGGAWAVLDTKINPTCITMLADPLARGGVLEPSGIVEIKFRQPQLYALMRKDDQLLRELEEKAADPTLDKVEKAAAAAAVEKRRELLTPTYHAAAIMFSDMHDTTPRMLATGAIHDEVMWRDARNYFFHLLQVQLSLFRMARRYVSEALGKDLDDLKVRHLEQAKNWLLNHLNQKGIRFNRAVKEPKYEGTHRIYDYDAENLIKYEESEEFARELRRLKSERTRQAILSDTDLLRDLLTSLPRSQIEQLLKRQK